MSDLGLVARQVRVEQRVFWRNLPSAFFTFIMPIVLLVVVGTVFRSGQATVNGQRVGYNDYYIPALVAMGLMGACFTNIAMTTSIRRDNGVLKRLRGTPLPPWAFMAGVLGSSMVISLGLVVVTAGFGMVALGTSAPRHPLGLVLVLLAGALCFCALGLAMSALIPNADGAPAIVNGVFVPLVLMSGTFFVVPGDTLLGAISSLFPVRHFIYACYAAFDPGATGGSGVAAGDLLILLLWGVVGLAVALRWFRWEPHRA